MIHIMNKLDLPKELYVAVSGGLDSIVAVDFLSKNRNITCVHFNHGTSDCDNAEEFVKSFCSARNLKLVVGKIQRDIAPKESLEEYWRNCRYDFFNTIPSTIVTAHTLSDCVETYIHSSLTGTPKVIPYRRNNVIRPFLTTPRSAMEYWADRKGLSWYEEASNGNMKIMRNFIRKNIVPQAYVVNPGLDTLVKKIVVKQINKTIP